LPSRRHDDGPPQSTLKTLARAGLIGSRRGVRIAARQAAAELAKFDPTYLLLPN
jgi:hypothetical protein